MAGYHSWRVYSAYDSTTGTTVADHISGAGADFTTGERVGAAEEVPFYIVNLIFGDMTGVEVFIRAVEGLSYELSAVLQQIGTDLSACLGKSMESIQVDVMSKLRDDTTEIPISSLSIGNDPSWDPRIASQGGRKAVKIRIQSFWLSLCRCGSCCHRAVGV